MDVHKYKWACTFRTRIQITVHCFALLENYGDSNMEDIYIKEENEDTKNERISFRLLLIHVKL